MSQFYDQASLVMVPSGYKDGKLYSQKPLSTSGELSFSRGSDIEATRVNSQGLIQKAQVNLALQSNSFNNWTNISSTDTGGQSGYDGSSDAWLLEKTASDGRIAQLIATSGVQTASLYAKAGTLDWISLFMASSSNNYLYFDLANGVKGTSGAATIIDSTITSVGGGWYRITITFNDTLTAFRIYPADGDGDTSGTSGNIYVQDAQLNYGLVAQTYQETTTAAVVSGITDNMPRLNYDPANPTCPSVILEPSRTNHYYNSEYFSTGSRVVFTQNAVTSPEGVSNGTSVVATSASGSHEVTLSPLISIANTNPRTFSIYAKYNGNHLILNVAGSSSSWTACIFDLQNGVAKTPQNNGSQTACTADIQDAGGGWYRCSITYTPYASGGFYHLISLTDDVNATLPTSNFGADNYTGDDVSGISIYGAQVEEGSYPTSYIPTYGSSATRTADACSKTGISSLIGQTEGTVYFEVEQSNTSGVNGAWSISDGSSTNRITMNTTNDTSTNFTFSVAANYAGSGTVLMSADATYAGTHKVAIKYSGTSMKLFVDGSEVDSATTTGFGNYTNYYLGANQVGGGASETRNFLQGLLFTSALSDADCITLTSL